MENSDNYPSKNILDMDDSEFVGTFGENPYAVAPSIEPSPNKYVDGSLNMGNEVVPGMPSEPLPLDIPDMQLSSQESDNEEEPIEYPEYSESEEPIEENYNNSGDEDDDEQVSDSPEPLYTIDDPESWFNAVTQPIEINGVELTLNDPETVRNLIIKGAESNLQRDSNKEQNRILKSLQKYNIDEKALNLLIGAYQGDRRALSKIVTRNAIIPVDLDYADFDDNYDKHYIVSQKDLEYESSINQLKSPDSKERIDNYFATLDQSSQEQLKLDPKVYPAFESFMEMGLHEKVLKQIARNKINQTYDYRQNDITNYQATLLDIINKEKAQKNNKDFVNEDYRDPRKSAGLSRNRSFTGSSQRKKKKSVTTADIINMSDEDFLRAFGKSF